MELMNRQIVLAARPVGDAKPSDFALVERALPVPREGEVLVRNILVSLDPYQRSLMGNASTELPPLDVGRAMPGPTVAIVEQSRHPGFAVGDHVASWLGWQERGLGDGSDLRKIDPSSAPISTAIGVLGHTGLTAWIGTTKYMAPKAGGTFVVTAAAGAVGSVAAQLAKLRGHRVVGIAGGPEKARRLVERLGLDAGVDYKDPGFSDRLAAALPDGLDALFDNVGGWMFEALMPYFNMGAQVVVCGTIAQYSHPGTLPGPDRLPDLLKLFLYRFIEVRGFALPDHFASYPDFLAEVRPLVTQGRLKHEEEFVDGIESIPGAFTRLFDGRNRGKLIARVG